MEEKNVDINNEEVLEEKKEPCAEPEEVKESLMEIHTQTDRMSALVSQLLTMARADRGIEQLKKTLLCRHKRTPFFLYIILFFAPFSL